MIADRLVGHQGDPGSDQVAGEVAQRGPHGLLRTELSEDVQLAVYPAGTAYLAKVLGKKACDRRNVATLDWIEQKLFQAFNISREVIRLRREGPEVHAIKIQDRALKLSDFREKIGYFCGP